MEFHDATNMYRQIIAWQVERQRTRSKAGEKRCNTCNFCCTEKVYRYDIDSHYENFCNTMQHVFYISSYGYNYPESIREQFEFAQASGIHEYI